MASRNVGYARVSTTDQDTDPQVARLRAAGCDPIFVDDGVSGALASRPEWDKCLASLQAGDVLVAVKLDRFGRSVSHLVELSKTLTARSVGLRCLDQPIDTTTAVGNLIFQVLSAIAEFERELTRERIKDKLAFNAKAGKVGRRRSFGYEEDGVTAREDEAAILRDCAARLLAGESQDALIKELTALGVPTIRGAAWGYTTFRQLMTRPRNAGYLLHNGTIVGRPIEPILDESTWRRVVALYESRRPGRQPSGRYLLTGLVYCHCGAPLAGRPVTGTDRRQYWCRAKHASRIFVTTDRLDEWAEHWTIETLANPEHWHHVAREESEAEARLAAIAREANEIEATLIALAGRLGRQEISLARHDAAANPLDARLAELSEEAAGITLPPPTPRNVVRFLPDSATALLLDWEDGGIAERRAMVQRALNGQRIVVGPGRAARFDPARVYLSGV